MRHYLMLDSDLESLLDAWGIAATGTEALRFATLCIRVRAADARLCVYRLGFCSRGLISQFSFGASRT